MLVVSTFNRFSVRSLAPLLSLEPWTRFSLSASLGLAGLPYAGGAVGDSECGSPSHPCLPSHSEEAHVWLAQSSIRLSWDGNLLALVSMLALLLMSSLLTLVTSGTGYYWNLIGHYDDDLQMSWINT